jgi:hypothetical protein
MITRDKSKKTLADFKGCDIAMPFRADMPDIVFEEIVKERVRSSLLLIKPDKASITVEEGPNLLKRIRSRFHFAGEGYWMPVTDPVIENRYFGEEIGQYPINKKDVYFTVSIGEPYEGYCYKLVAGVIF